MECRLLTRRQDKFASMKMNDDREVEDGYFCVSSKPFLFRYFSRSLVINTLGATANDLVSTLGYTMALDVDSHDACVTAPVPTSLTSSTIKPLIVDIRNRHQSSCFYFYQNLRNQLVISNAPFPSVSGYDTRETANFLPNISRRMLELFPIFKTVEVRRVWRGLYANTKDGNPLVGFDRYHEGLVHALGMGGQGFMLGPGIGKLILRTVTGWKGISPDQKEKDKIALEEFDPFRTFAGGEELLR